MKINAKVRKEAGKAIWNTLKPTYFDSIPLLGIQDALKPFSLMICDEEGNPWEGLLCGREAHEIFPVASTEGQGKVENASLCLSWYKMPSGRYEVIGYLS